MDMCRGDARGSSVTPGRKEAGCPGCGTVNKETVSDRVPRSPIHVPVRREPLCPDPASGWVLEERAQNRNKW
jgi:hypothetical protein